MSKILIDEATVKLALEALELAQDNLRDHGDNCFLHDEGEYNRCFCGKDSLSDHLQSVVEKLDEALAEQPAQQRHISYVCPQCYWSLDEQPAQQEPVGEVGEIDIDEDGQAFAWLALHKNVDIGDKLYTKDQL